MECYRSFCSIACFLGPCLPKDLVREGPCIQGSVANLATLQGAFFGTACIAEICCASGLSVESLSWKTCATTPKLVVRRAACTACVPLHPFHAPTVGCNSTQTSPRLARGFYTSACHAFSIFCNQWLYHPHSVLNLRPVACRTCMTHY